jgi:hypothetical protein
MAKHSGVPAKGLPLLSRLNVFSICILLSCFEALWRGEGNKNEWLPVQVAEYDTSRGYYRVVWENADISTSWEPRINIMFLAEDPFNFINRIAAAHFMRKNAEMLLVCQANFNCGVAIFLTYF